MTKDGVSTSTSWAPDRADQIRSIASRLTATAVTGAVEVTNRRGCFLVCSGAARFGVTEEPEGWVVVEIEPTSGGRRVWLSFDRNRSAAEATSRLIRTVLSIDASDLRFERMEAATNGIDRRHYTSSVGPICLHSRKVGGGHRVLPGSTCIRRTPATLVESGHRSREPQ